MKYLSLFSGIGGFEKGIQQAYERLYNSGNPAGESQTQGELSAEGESITSKGGEMSGNSSESSPLVCVGYSEIDKYATQIYQRHFPNHKNYGDITKIKTETLPGFDLLVGGFPCQSFSIAGKRGGFSDTRGTLFFEIARIIRDKQPSLLLLENVKGLLSHDEGRTFATIISTLDELGYDLQWQVLNSKNFGVPQNRERVFIVGHLRGTSRPEVFPITGQTETVADTTFYDESQWRREGKLREYDGISPTINTAQGGGHIPMISHTVRSSGRASGIDKKQNWDSYEIEGKIRRLTPTECERLQGFEDGWTEGVSDTQRYKTLGNAVTVSVIQAIVERLIHTKNLTS